ncbi:MAG: hypothetical protein HQL77_00750 [Magnetococcales bacterium]|nr:hypothetical protein [Magnetococcales bacterium]
MVIIPQTGRALFIPDYAVTPRVVEGSLSGRFTERSTPFKRRNGSEGGDDFQTVFNRALEKNPGNK